jgi:hypothetical protein
MGIRFGSDPAAPGAELAVDGATVGTVTSSVASTRWGPIGLAYLKRGAEPGPVRVAVDGVDQPSGAEVVTLPLAPAPSGSTTGA